MKKLKIGLDWDGTVNADPLAFKKIVEVFLDLDHDVVVTTWRSEPEAMAGWDRDPGGVYPDMEEIFNMWGFKIPVVYCNGRAKRDCYPADIWIDDNPASVMFQLEAKPRYVANPSDYDQDLLTLNSLGHEPLTVTWAQIKPRDHDLVSPVNYQETA